MSSDSARLVSLKILPMFECHLMSQPPTERVFQVMDSPGTRVKLVVTLDKKLADAFEKDKEVRTKFSVSVSRHSLVERSGQIAYLL